MPAGWGRSDCAVGRRAATLGKQVHIHANIQIDQSGAQVARTPPHPWPRLPVDALLGAPAPDAARGSRKARQDASACPVGPRTGIGPDRGRPHGTARRTGRVGRSQPVAAPGPDVLRRDAVVGLGKAREVERPTIAHRPADPARHDAAWRDLRPARSLAARRTEDGTADGGDAGSRRNAGLVDRAAHPPGARTRAVGTRRRVRRVLIVRCTCSARLPGQRRLTSQRPARHNTMPSPFARLSFSRKTSTPIPTSSIAAAVCVTSAPRLTSKPLR